MQHRLLRRPEKTACAEWRVVMATLCANLARLWSRMTRGGADAGGRRQSLLSNDNLRTVLALGHVPFGEAADWRCFLPLMPPGAVPSRPS